MASSSWVSTSSASSNRPSTYDVFINFRGSDTRTNFVSLLYKDLIKEGIHAYRDSEELWEGEDICPSLLRGIRGSNITIPVFSKNYAESKYCLVELAEIWECHLSNGQTILPVFIDVEPRDVRHQTKSFEEPFWEHQKKCDSAQVKNWKNALKEVGNLKGWVLKADATIEDQSNVIELIVQSVLREPSSSPLGKCKHSVGIDSHINELLSLLNIDSSGIRFVAICGMGGLGKTTIAKAIYNCIFKSFNGSSFLTDVREEALQGDKGLVSLQNRLLKDILKRDHDVRIVSQGSELIKRLLHGKKVLLILDDVDDHVQLDVLAGGINWFGEGSRVIITTRDDQSLNAHKADKDIQIYKPYGLNFENSLQLLSLFAFSKNEPPEKYKQLSYKIVQYAEGLPLTLEVLGSFLVGKEKEEWEDTMEGLKDIFDNKVSGMSITSYDEKVFAKLMISYNKLSDHGKIIFLDIACHFIGWRAEEAISIWEACELRPKLVIKELTQKHLLKIDSDGALRMHDQLQFMGRRIISKDSHGDPAKRSRLWSHDEILKVLQHGTGTQMVEGILFSSDMHIDDLSFEDFAKMPNLRFIDGLSGGKIFNGDFSHLPSRLRWFCWRQFPLKILPINFYHEELVHLDLSSSVISVAWSDKPQNKNTRFQKLKVLILSGCLDLSGSIDFFSWFPCLQRLDLSSCMSLVELPDSICEITSLKSLILNNCESINKLPMSIGNLKHLVELSVSETKIEELPDGVGHLQKLEKLDVSCCRKLVRLPTSMGRMGSLLHFNLEYTMIEKLPDDFSKLLSLEVLRMGMVELDDQIDYKRLQPLLISMSAFSRLQELYLKGYMNLESLPELPPTLIRLKVEKCISLQIISDLSHLEMLEELSLYDAKSLVRLPDLSSLERLSSLDISGCENLEKIQGLQGTESLKKLRAKGCHKLTELMNLSKLKGLVELDISCENLENIEGLQGTESLEVLIVQSCHKVTELPDLSNLKRLKHIEIGDCENVEGFHCIEGMESLEVLIVQSCHKLTELPDLSNLKRLRRIQIGDCENVEGIHFIEGMESLEVQSCHKLTELPDLSNLKRLRRIQIGDCENVEGIHFIEGMESLEVLIVQSCHKVTELPDLSNLKRLMELNINDCANLGKIHSIKGSESLEVLRVKGCNKLTELSDMSNLKRLMELHIEDCANLEEIHSIKGSESLKVLTVEGCHKLRELPDMSNLKGLGSLCIINCVNLQKIHRFEGAESLKFLLVQDCYKLTETTRKIHGQGRLLVDNVGKGFGQGTNSIGTDDHHVYPGSPFLCIVLAFTSGSGDRSERVKFVVGELVTITLQISAYICWGEKDTMFVYSIRIEDIEFTERDIIYIDHFKVLDWFPLESQPAIKGFRGSTLEIFRHSDSHHYSYDQINVCVKHWKVLFEDIESEQQMPNQQSSAMLVADFFRWDEEEGADKEVEEKQDANNDDELVEDKEDADSDEEDKKAGGSGVCNCFVAVKAVWDGFCNCFSRGFWRYVTGAS